MHILSKWERFYTETEIKRKVCGKINITEVSFKNRTIALLYRAAS